MSNKVVHFKSIGPVTFFRNRRSGGMKISIRPDRSVLVSFPFFVSEKEVLSFLSRNEDWICRQQEKMVDSQKALCEGTIIKTKMHTVELRQGEVTGEMNIKDKMVTVYVRDFESENTRFAVKAIITQIYRYEANILLPPRLKKLAIKYGFCYNKVSVRNKKHNWGSCSSGNNISLNLQMIKLPDELIDYILLHELVHTEIKDHSSRFWERLDRLTNYCARDMAQQVKKYSTYTL